MDNWEYLPAMITQDLRFDEMSNDFTQNADFQEFRNKLIKLIQDMLPYQPERLAQAMYRIDVNEWDFRQALAENNAEKIADLVIQRELQKIITRQKYSVKK
jgi:hypothetical protein